MIVFQYVAGSYWKITFVCIKKQHCNILLKGEIKFRKTFETVSTAELNSLDIRKSFFLNREIKFHKNFFP